MGKDEETEIAAERSMLIFQNNPAWHKCRPVNVYIFVISLNIPWEYAFIRFL